MYEFLYKSKGMGLLMRDLRVSEKYCNAVFKVEIPHLYKILEDIKNLEEDEKNGIQHHRRNNNEIIYRRKKL